MTEQELILTVGLPRSGKTTWARTQGLPIVSPDAIRLALHGQRFVDDTEPLVWVVAKYMVRALFIAGHARVIVDATNTTQKRRAEWQSRHWAVRHQVFPTSKAECIRRADAALVPVIERMADQWDFTTPLNSDEA